MAQLPIQPFAKLLILAGIILLVAGVILLFTNKIPFLGRLPGDILIQRKNFYFLLSFSNNYFIKFSDIFNLLFI